MRRSWCCTTRAGCGFAKVDLIDSTDCNTRYTCTGIAIAATGPRVHSVPVHKNSRTQCTRVHVRVHPNASYIVHSSMTTDPDTCHHTDCKATSGHGKSHNTHKLRPEQASGHRKLLGLEFGSVKITWNYCFPFSMVFLLQRVAVARLGVVALAWTSSMHKGHQIWVQRSLNRTLWPATALLHPKTTVSETNNSLNMWRYWPNHSHFSILQNLPVLNVDLLFLFSLI